MFNIWNFISQNVRILKHFTKLDFLQKISDFTIESPGEKLEIYVSK